MTNATKPPMRKSDEATEEQLQVAKEQGDTLGKALHHMVSEEADDGAEKTAGEYLVGYAVEKAEGMYQLVDGELVWQEVEDENVHLEVSVRDGADGRFIPNLNVHARLIDSSGNDIGLHRQPYIWHPWLYHYGRNWKVPGDGTYQLQVRIEAPDFPRHDKKNGRRFAEDVEVGFDNVKIKTGQK